MGGTIAKPKGLKPGTLTAKAKAKPTKPATPRGPATSRLRPGELMNAVARPVGTMARPRKGENPFGTKDKTKKQNLSIALSWLDSKGFKGQLYSEGAKLRGQAIARFIPSTPVVRYNKDGSQSRAMTQGELQLNQSNNYWRNPRLSNTRNRATGFLSTSSPVGTLYHEIGHSRDKRLSLPGYARNWGTAYSGTKQETKAIARRVSRYATTNPAEFIAETYAGLKTGRRYDFQVMRAYREAMGLSPTAAAAASEDPSPDGKTGIAPSAPWPEDPPAAPMSVMAGAALPRLAPPPPRPSPPPGERSEARTGSPGTTAARSPAWARTAPQRGVVASGPPPGTSGGPCWIG
jgi:hypothetical protein